MQTDPIDDTPPAVLGEAGQEMWRHLVGRLGSVGALDEVDRWGMLALCLQWDRAMQAGAVLREQGHFAKGSKGQLVPHPAVGIESRALDRVVKYASEFAATPIARTRAAAARSESNAAREFEEIIDAEPAEIDDAGDIDADSL